MISAARPLRSLEPIGRTLGSRPVNTPRPSVLIPFIGGKPGAPSSHYRFSHNEKKQMKSGKLFSIRSTGLDPKRLNSRYKRCARVSRSKTPPTQNSFHGALNPPTDSTRQIHILCDAHSWPLNPDRSAVRLLRAQVAGDVLLMSLQGPTTNFE